MLPIYHGRMPHLDVVIPLRWSDLDAYAHVNNAAVVGLLEEARIAAFWAPAPEQLARGAEARATQLDLFGPRSAMLTLIASQRLEYHRPIDYLREGVLVRLWVSRIGGASFDVDYRILRSDDGEGAAPYASARTTIVIVDRATGGTSRLDASSREVLAALQDEPIAFRG